MYVNFTFFNYYIRVILIGMWKIKPVEKQSIYMFYLLNMKIYLKMSFNNRKLIFNNDNKHDLEFNAIIFM